MPAVKTGWNLPFGTKKFDILVEPVDLQVLLAEHGIDPTRLVAGHTNEKGEPDFLTFHVQFRLQRHMAEFYSMTAYAYELGRSPDQKLREQAEGAQREAEAHQASMTNLLKSVAAGEIR